MPRNPVINRRNITNLKQRSLSASDPAVELVQNIAKQLHVSQGSMVDTALREFGRRSPIEIAELLHLHGHLTDEEFAVVAKLAVSAGPEPDTPEQANTGGASPPEGI